MSQPIEVPLFGGHVAIVDEHDWPLIAEYHWCARKHRHTFYCVTKRQVGGRNIFLRMHRLILNAPAGVPVDHRDHNGLNNLRANLRLCTNSQNAANRRNLTTNTSGYRGVYFHKQTGRWRASIKVDQTCIHLGVFSDPWDAACAYNRAAADIFGEFAYINIINSCCNPGIDNGLTTAGVTS